MQVEANGQPLPADRPARANGVYLELGQWPAGTALTVSYPLPVHTEEITIGNPGYHQWPYRVTWKGDTVLSVEGLETEVTHTYSDFDKVERPAFYGAAGPGRLYQRAHLLADAAPADAPLCLDSGALDLWKINRL